MEKEYSWTEREREREKRREKNERRRDRFILGRSSCCFFWTLATASTFCFFAFRTSPSSLLSHLTSLLHASRLWFASIGCLAGPELFLSMALCSLMLYATLVSYHSASSYSFKVARSASVTCLRQLQPA